MASRSSNAASAAHDQARPIQIHSELPTEKAVRLLHRLCTDVPQHGLEARPARRTATPRTVPRRPHRGREAQRTGPRHAPSTRRATRHASHAAAQGPPPVPLLGPAPRPPARQARRPARAAVRQPGGTPWRPGALRGQHSVFTLCKREYSRTLFDSAGPRRKTPLLGCITCLDMLMTPFHLWDLPGDVLAAPESALGLDRCNLLWGKFGGRRCSGSASSGARQSFLILTPLTHLHF